MAIPDGFDSILGRFEPTGQCSASCSRVGWNMTGGLCSDHFRIRVLDAKQREAADLWDIHEMIVFHEMPVSEHRPATKPVQSQAVQRPAPTFNDDEEL